MNTDLVTIIFGMKVRQARLEAGLSLSQFAQRCDLSPSYITEIEKGRKYPKTDKILKMAEVLGKSYDELVSIKLGPALEHLEGMLASPLWQEFPFEAFDLEAGTLVNIFTRAPAKASALLHAVLEIGRQYDMKNEHFLWAALRSYQEIHENYFADLEAEALGFMSRFGLDSSAPPAALSLRRLIEQEFGYRLDTTGLTGHPLLAHYRSVYLDGPRPRLLLNGNLQDNQVNFILARELGYQFLGLKQRASTSAPEQVESFEQVLNDFKASYFAGALLMPQAPFLADIRYFFHRPTWDPGLLLGLLTKYNVTPEMLFYRFSELVPQFFGIRLHFHRFHKSNESYKLVKQLNMNQLLAPSGAALNEHYCRRWMAIRLLREMCAAENPQQFSQTPLVGVQISESYGTGHRFLSMGFAQPLALSPQQVGNSVIIGYQLTPELSQTIKFVDDPAIPIIVINETCERCPLPAAKCDVRSVPPIVLEAEHRLAQRQQALAQLISSLEEK